MKNMTEGEVKMEILYYNNTFNSSEQNSGYNVTQPHIIPIPPTENDCTTPYIKYGAFFIGVVGILVNGFVVFILLRDQKLRSRISNMLITNQTLVDFIASFFFIMCFGSKAVDKRYSGLGGELICRLLDSEGPVWLFLCISTSGLVLLTIERYLIIVHPLFYRNTVNSCLVKLAIVTSWFLTTALVGILLFYTSGIGDDGKCYTVELWPNESMKRTYCIFYIVVTFICPVGIFIGCYSHMMIAMATRLKLRYLKSEMSIQVENRVISTLKHNTAGSRLSRKQVNLTKTMVIVSVCFILCFGPSNVHYFLTTFDLVPGLELSGPLYTCLTYLVFLNTCMNPIIYAIKYEDVRKEARHLLRLKRSSGRSEGSDRQSQATVFTASSNSGNTQGLSVSNTMLASDIETSGEVKDTIAPENE